MRGIEPLKVALVGSGGVVLAQCDSFLHTTAILVCRRSHDGFSTHREAVFNSSMRSESIDQSSLAPLCWINTK